MDNLNEFLQPKKNENEEQYIWRLGQAKDNQELDFKWEDVAKYVNKYFRLDGTIYKPSAYRKPYQQTKRFFEAGVFDKNSDRSEYADYRIDEMEKIKIQTQTEKLEFQKWKREYARDELILEKIQESISKLEPLKIPNKIEHKESNKSYLLAYGDAHYGVEFELKDLFGNVINSYSPEIFEQRMWDMYEQIVEIVHKEQINELNVFDLGDGIDGIIRLSSQLMKLRYGVIDSTVRYAEFIAEWLNKLSKHVRIKFQMVLDSNHSQLRICGANKNYFQEENMNKIMVHIIKDRTKNNENIFVIENPTGMNYEKIFSYSILGIHGECKNIANAVNDFSRTYDTKISYMIGAHVHHKKSEEVGMNCEVLSVRSIIGVDPYGLSLNKVSNSGASLFTFDKKRGLVCENRLVLN